MNQLNIYNQNSKNETLPQILNFKDSKIRVILDPQGDPWFVATEVAKILGYRMASDATRILDLDEKSTHNLRTLGGTQKVSTINESGLYSLIFASRKPEARIFKKWVTSDVLPTIRKTGSYGKRIDLNNAKQLHKLLLETSDSDIAIAHSGITFSIN